MADMFQTYNPDLEGPAGGAFAITPSDSTDLAQATRGIYVGGAGNISLITIYGQTVTLVGVVPGTVIPVRANRIKATSTTATSLVGLY
jgi:hypothetical protein